MRGHSPTLLSLAVGFALLAILFGILERSFPAIRGISIWRKHRRVDYLYWLFTPLVSRTISVFAAGASVILLAAVTGQRVEAAGGLVTRQPRLAQAAELLVLSDLIGYWMHRLFHREPLWKFHAIHHSSEQLDWLSATRLHPINEVLTRLAQVVPLFLLGFRGSVIATVVPLLTLYSIFLHANVPWSYGRFGWLIASPVFHRWHHTTAEEGRDRNFAGLFPWIDRAFGTFYLPEGRQPSAFGLAGESVPVGLIGQLMYPFRQRRAA